MAGPSAQGGPRAHAPLSRRAARGRSRPGSGPRSGRKSREWMRVRVSATATPCARRPPGSDALDARVVLALVIWSVTSPPSPSTSPTSAPRAEGPTGPLVASPSRRCGSGSQGRRRRRLRGRGVPRADAIGAVPGPPRRDSQRRAVERTARCTAAAVTRQSRRVSTAPDTEAPAGQKHGPARSSGPDSPAMCPHAPASPASPFTGCDHVRSASGGARPSGRRLFPARASRPTPEEREGPDGLDASGPQGLRPPSAPHGSWNAAMPP